MRTLILYDDHYLGVLDTNQYQGLDLCCGLLVPPRSDGQIATSQLADAAPGQLLGAEQ
jgi:hypothetical protein